MTESIAERLSRCNACGNKYAKEPFYFPMMKQKVMLISANPSIQAMYRPMTSIRFFRRMCTALFGEAGISQDIVKIFHENIYWTHYHKCHLPSFHSTEDKKLPNDCCKEYIVEEIRTLNPELIIILDEPTANALVGQKVRSQGMNLDGLENQPIEIVFLNKCAIIADFPDDGEDKERFSLIRKALSKIKGFEFINILSQKLLNPINEIRGRLAVNIDFEQIVLNQIVYESDVFQVKTIDDIWLERVVLPNQKNYLKISQIAFFVEDEIKSFLLDFYNRHYHLHNNDLNFIYRIRKPQEYIDYNYFNENTSWSEIFGSLIGLLFRKNIVNFWNIAQIDNIDIVNTKLRNLMQLRNTIVHQGGTYSSSDKRKPIFDGVGKYGNMLLVNDVGVNNVMSFSDIVVSTIKAAESVEL